MAGPGSHSRNGRSHEPPSALYKRAKEEFERVLALTLATAGGMTWVAGRIYANSVFRLGARVRVMDALHGK